MLDTDLSFSPPFMKLLAARQLTDPGDIEAFFFAGLERLSDPLIMKGMKEAVVRLKRAALAKETVLVHGDYDVDGMTGAAILIRTLQALHIQTKMFLPDRSEDGYGVSMRAIRMAREAKAGLIMTVDCGITAAAQIRQAREWGMDVIVIDHHRLPAEGLPPANIILNPLQEDCPYAFKELSAAGLAFKLSQALIGERAYRLLDLAALSTISDVAPLIGENRIIVREGLKRLSERTNKGLAALAKVAALKSRTVNVGHVGFVIAPRLNAAGRMSSAEIALQLLLTENEREAQSLANVLQEENKARQREEQQVVRQAVQEVERTTNFNRDRVIVVGRKGWHAGVIGIVASRLVDRYHRPAVVIAFEEESGRGSGRSIKGFHLYHAFQAARGFLDEFGGHAQAAGLKIRESQLAAFRACINDHAREAYRPEDFQKVLRADLELKLEDLRNPFLEELKMMEPHGAGNPRPAFMTRGLRVSGKPFRLSPQTLRFWVTDGVFRHEALWTDRSEAGGQEAVEEGVRIDLYYSIKTKIWDGIESVSLDVKGIKAEI